ncbi:ATP-binding cassette domain-containing protein [Candidatus Saccharibacteria bacterium]|nr:ATP-binding cassette domain-containing protein [Candidatus Saccharibacteria bacterium]
MLDLQNIEFVVKNGAKRRTIIQDLSLSVKAGEFVAITGPNGSGKSSLARLIMGINRASAGKLIFNGQDITEKTITERAKLGIAYSFQQPVHFKGLSVRDLLQVAATAKETFLQDTGTDYEKLLATVGLSQDYLERQIDNSLSGGELKRVEIASVLARGAKLMVFDEPEAGIDIWSFARLTDVFRKLHKKPDCAIVVISHQKSILNIADRVVILKDGKIQAQGRPEDLKEELAL